MTIKSEPFYWLECDDCGVKSTEDSDYVAWQSPDQAVDNAADSDWLITDDGKHYCYDCEPKHRPDEDAE